MVSGRDREATKAEPPVSGVRALLPKCRSLERDARATVYGLPRAEGDVELKAERGGNSFERGKARVRAFGLEQVDLLPRHAQPLAELGLREPSALTRPPELQTNGECRGHRDEQAAPARARFGRRRCFAVGEV